jgi:hypothetical protein
LPLTGILYLGPIGERQDDQGVVYLLPIEEVKASDGAAQEGDPSDGRSCSVCHDGDVVGPVKSVVEVDTQVLEGFDGRDMVGVTGREGVLSTVDGWADKLGVCAFGGEGHEFGLGGVSLEAIL